MKVSEEEQIHVFAGRLNPNIFKYRVIISMNVEIDKWLQDNFNGYGQDYYYNAGEVWFRRAEHEFMFILRWA